MSGWLSFLFIKFILPLLLQEVIKLGLMNDLQAAAIKTFEDFKLWMSTLRTYSTPTDFPNAPPDPTPNNFTTGQAPEDDGYPKSTR